MNIKSAKYIRSSHTEENACIKIILNDMSENTFISVPLDPNNSDYAEIMKQVKEGTLTIQDAD